MKFIIFPDDPLKIIWDLVLGLMILYICFFLPFRLAFLTDESEYNFFIYLDYFIDSVFYLDIIFNFFTAYVNSNETLVTSHKKIAIHYLSTWFIIDFFATFPFDKIIKNNNRYNEFLRFAKLPRLYKLLRLAKFLRFLRFLRERSKIFFLMSIKFGEGFNKLFFSVLSILCFAHIAACFWYLASDLSSEKENWIIYYNYTDSSILEKYIGKL